MIFTLSDEDIMMGRSHTTKSVYCKYEESKKVNANNKNDMQSSRNWHANELKGIFIFLSINKDLYTVSKF